MPSFKKMPKLPELLAPAGSPAALEAAIDAGADAVYFGGASHNARMGAVNFDAEDMRKGIRLAHAYGVKCYVTLNTLVTDRELDGCLAAAAEDYEAGADALIIADLGVAAAVKKYIPELTIHASTQASGHSVNAAAELERLGFSRMVMAREASLEDIRYFTANSKTELEVFVHGALCMSASGQCLFSSIVGGRSGNRGECAQPCRLPYLRGKKEYYPLSLKDLCLARHVPLLIESGVASLKLEGRMKPPEYVSAVTRIWRRLLDEQRAASNEEMKYLAEIFSRGGFTDGYFTGRINSSMLGVRSETDKLKTRALPTFSGLSRKLPLTLDAEIHSGEPVRLTLKCGERTVSAVGEPPQKAKTAPMTDEAYAKSLTKLGDTPYKVEKLVINADAGLMVPVSQLNALRRAAVEFLMSEPNRKTTELSFVKALPTGKRARLRTATVCDPKQVTEKARAYFDMIYLPLERYNGEAAGIIMPPVIFDSEAEKTKRLLAEAVKKGASCALVGNVGHLKYAKDAGLSVYGDLRLNIFNTEAAVSAERLGIDGAVASPELTVAQLRDIGGNTGAVVYGRLPLMLLEKCVISEISGCDRKETDEACRGRLTDRRGVTFSVLSEGEHRNIIYNSLPTCMSDKQDELEQNGICNMHFIFTTEAPDEVDRVINAFEKRISIGIDVRRIKKA